MKAFVMVALLCVTSTAAAQHAAPPGHEHGAAGPGQGHLVAQSCADEFEKVVGSGRGFGLAFAADQNGYPGPMHVLELKDRLKLTADQEAKMHTLMAAMFSESQPKSARLLDAERKLRRLFADSAASRAAVRAAAAEVEHARAEVRLVHLLTHLRTRDLLTDEQRRLYQEARWPKP